MSWERAYARALVVTDFAAVVVASGLVIALGIAPVDDASWSNAGAADDLVVTASAALLWVVAAALAGAYEVKTVGIGSEEYLHVGRGALIALATATFLAFTFELGVSRAYLLATFGVAVVAVGAVRQVSRKHLHRQRAAGRFSRRVLVVGSAPSVCDLVRHFQRAPFAGYTVIGASIPGSSSSLSIGGAEIPVLGEPARVLDTVATCEADTLAVADPTVFAGSDLRSLGWELEGTGVELIVVPAVTEVAGPRISVRPVAGVPLLHVEEPSLSGAARTAKNGFDRAFALVAGLILLPVLAAIALSIRLTSRGPVLFRQTRVGQDGKEFRMLKFRTMVAGADDRVHEVRPLAADPEAMLFKVPDDPRRTPIGRWLRRHSLDELPQLWNVLTGTMSIVGPRPPLPEEVARYASPAHRRLLVKPGLTGLWQVSGRADLSWDDAVRLDLYYVENWSWVLDALILVRTIPAVVKGRGAY